MNNKKLELFKSTTTYIVVLFFGAVIAPIVLFQGRVSEALLGLLMMGMLIALAAIMHPLLFAKEEEVRTEERPHENNKK